MSITCQRRGEKVEEAANCMQQDKRRITENDAVDCVSELRDFEH
jgi:hypothetical protein